MTSGEPYHMTFQGLETVYRLMPLPPTGLQGDVNGSGKVDIDDLNLLINIILELAPTNAHADVDGSGSVDIDDLNTLINILLSL